MGACSIKMNDDGSFNLLVGATDLGTGADTVLAQIAAEVLGVAGRRHHRLLGRHRPDAVRRRAPTPSGTTYISGMAVKKAAEAVRGTDRRRGRRGCSSSADPADGSSCTTGAPGRPTAAR